MKKTRLLALLIALFMVMGILAACADPVEEAPDEQPPDTPPPVTQNDDEEDEEDEVAAPPVGIVSTQDTLTILGPSLAVNLLPWATNDMPSAEMQAMLYDRLFVQDYETFLPIPERGLAINWSQPDARTTHIEIRQGVYFHNGDPLTAHDVAFSLTMSSNSPFNTPFLGMIESAVAHDNYNLTVTTEMDFSPIIAHLAHTGASVVNSRIVQEYGEEEFSANPVGSGPWMFDQFILGDRIELVRNPNYWGQAPILERLIFRVVPEPSVRLMEVQAGTADKAMALAPIDVPMAEADPNVTVHRRPNLSITYIGFNALSPHLDNPLVRRAINYAIDVDAIVENVFLGTGEQLAGPFPRLVWGFERQEPFPHNMDRARELLIEAGYNPTPGEPGGFSTSIWWNIPNTQREMIAEMVAFALAMLNIHVDIVAMEWAAYLDGTAAGDHDMFLLGYVSVTGDPDYSLFPLFHTANWGTPGNRSFSGSPELDALLEAGRSELDPQRRLEIYAEAQYYLRNDAPWVFLHHAETLIASVPNMEGFVINPAGHHNWTNIWFS